jgi:hypothetical protein
MAAGILPPLRLDLLGHTRRLIPQELGNMLELGDLIERQCFEAAYLPGLLDATRIGRLSYELPIAVERQNLTFYNTRILDEAGLRIPTNPTELLELAINLQNLGFSHPICEVDAGSFLFDFILATFGGASYLEEFWLERVSTEDAVFQAALGFALSLWPFVRESRGPAASYHPEWLTETGPDACPIGLWGDFALASLLSQGARLDTDFVVENFPGADSFNVVSGQSLSLLADAPTPTHYLALLATFGSRLGQGALAEVRPNSSFALRGLPVRTDLDPARLSESRLLGLEALETVRAVTLHYRQWLPSVGFQEFNWLKSHLDENDAAGLARTLQAQLDLYEPNR